MPVTRCGSACCRCTGMDSLRDLLQHTLLYVLLPMWMLAGLGDWLIHRVQRIEHTAGLKESLSHLAMLAELGPCLVLVLLFEINSLVLVTLTVACIAHELTVWWDLNYAMSRRTITVVEQWVHSFQLAAPWVTLVALVLLHWPQAQALAGFGPEAADWTLHWKEPGLPTPTIVGAIVLGVVMVAVPFAEETWRCWSVRSDEARPDIKPG